MRALVPTQIHCGRWNAQRREYTAQREPWTERIDDAFRNCRQDVRRGSGARDRVRAEWRCAAWATLALRSVLTPCAVYSRRGACCAR